MDYRKLNIQRIPKEVAIEVAVERERKGKTNDEIITECLAERYGIDWKDEWFGEKEREA